MASVYIPYIYPLVFYNINGNNNDKPSTPYPLILSSGQPSTSVPFVVPNSVATAVKESETEPSNQRVQIDKSQVIDNQSQVKCGRNIESEPQKGANLGAKKIMSEQEKPISRTPRRKRGLDTDTTSPAAVDEAEPSAKRKPRGRRGKRRKGFMEAPKKLPGTSLNICSNCGTVADKVKAKKCKNCQKFFFDHWAKRCRIPPCPNCHFSRKSRGCEVVPQFCERCGHPLKGDAKMDREQRASIGEASSIITEGESTCTSDTSSFQLSEDLHDVDNLSQSEDDDDDSVLEDVEKDSCRTTADVSKVEEHEEGEAHKGPSESCDCTGEAHDPSDKSHDISDEAVATSDRSHDISGESNDKSNDVADEEHNKKSHDHRDVDSRDKSHDLAVVACDTMEMSHDHTEPQVDDEVKSTKNEPVEPQISLGSNTTTKVEATNDSLIDNNPDNQPTVPPVDNQPTAPTVDNQSTAPTVDNQPTPPPVDNQPTAPPGDNASTPMETSEVKVHDSSPCSNPVDLSAVSLTEAGNTTSKAEADIQEVKDSSSVTDIGKTRSDPVECNSQTMTISVTGMETNIDATSSPLPEDSSKDECMESPATTSEMKSDSSTKVGQPAKLTENEQKLPHQDAPPLEQSQDSVTPNTGDMEAEPPIVEGQAPMGESPSGDAIDDGTKQEVTSIRCSLPVRFDEQVGADMAETESSSSLVVISRQTNPAYSEDQKVLPTVHSEDTTVLSIPTNTPVKKSKRVDSPSLTKSKGKSSKKPSTKSTEKKSPRKRSKKKGSIETASESTSTVATTPQLVATPPIQEVCSGEMKEKPLPENPVEPAPPTIPSVPLIASSAVDVGPLQSTSGTTIQQTEQSMVKLLQPLASMAATGMVAGLLNNLVENLKQNQVKQKEESPSSSLDQPTQVGGGNGHEQDSHKQINQQLKQSQQQCQQLINRTVMLLNPNSGTGNGSSLMPPSPPIQLPQKRAMSEVDEAATEESVDLAPTSSKKLKTSTQTSPSEEKIFPAGAALEDVMDKSEVPHSSNNNGGQHMPQEKITARGGVSSVIQSSSKLLPRSASLPPQLVPSSSLAMQESDDDSFPISSTPCLSHTLPPPPLLKPTSPSGGTTAAHPVMSSPESIPIVSLPSLTAAPAPLQLKPLSDTFSSLSSKFDSILESRSSSESSVIMRAGLSGGIQSTGEPASFSSFHVTGSDPLQSVKASDSHSLSLSPSPATCSFHRLEIGSPPAISGQPNKIRVSLLKPEGSSEAIAVSNADSANAISAQSPSDGAVGSMAFGGKFQNFALAPNLSVIATVETQTKTQSSSSQQQSGSRLSPTNSDGSSDSKHKADSQKSIEESQTTGQDSSRQCTPEDIEELSCLQKRISSALSSSNSVGFPIPSPVSQAQPPQSQQPPVPSLVGPIPTSLQSPIPNLPIPGRPGAVSVTVIKSSSQNESDSLFSNAGVQATNDSSPGPLGGSSSLQLGGAISSGSGSTTSVASTTFGGKLPNLSAIASLTSPLAPSVLQSPLTSKDVAGLPSIGVQAAAPSSKFRKIAPRKPGQSGLVTIQVCNTLPNSNSVTAAKMTSQSIGVGTEPSASQASNVRMSPGILRPRPSAQIGGVLVTPQPSVGVAATSPHLPPSGGQGVHRKPATIGGAANGEPYLFPSSPPNRSVYVTKLYSNVPSTATTQTGFQGYNPRTRSSLKELSSPAFEEALLSAAKQNAKQAPQEEEEGEKEKPSKKEKKRGGKVKAKEGGGGGGKTSGKSKKSKAKAQGDKGEKFATDEALARLMSEEVLDNESDQISETGSHNGNKKKPSAPGGHGGKSEVGDGANEGAGEENDNEEGEDERGGGGDKSPKKNKNGKIGGKKDSMKQLLYSVKLKDCFLHHMLWQDYRVVLLVPLNASGAVKSESPGSKSKSGGAEASTTPERKRRRKSKIEPLDINEIEAEMDPLVESPAMSSSHIHSPCFSVYELRNKLFSESNAVYAYTYKNQIKTLKPPLHWVHVLKRMGGMQENCHTCRLLDVGNVKGMSQHYGNSSSLPSSLENLCKNELPKGRKVIDLSSFDPEDLLESGQLDEIPQCSFMEKPPSKKKTPTSATSKKKHKKQPAQTSTVKPEKDLMDEFLEQSQNKSLEGGSRGHPQPEQGVGQSHDLEEGDNDDDEEEEEEGRLVIAQDMEEDTPTRSAPQRSPPPLIKHESPSSSSSKNPQKKKFCPDCGTQIARKCKKCPTCGKRFGVFTFGRKLCPGCGRVNLARMTACYECGHSMQFAQKALPKGVGDDPDTDVKPSAHHRSDFVFGSRKRHRVPPLPYSSEYADGFSTDAIKAPKLSASAPGESDSRLPSLGDADEFYEHGDGMFPDENAREGDDSVMYEVPGAHGSKKSKHLGYQYGRVPWGDADITCLVDENGTPKFCLQELCGKVLRNQVKADVFDMVKNLNLPVLQGDTALLKKLQALGLHSNRSPICRLIGAEELWTLLDALQEPVPEEVHQHLENISSSTTPLLQSPSHTGGVATSTGPVLHSPGLVAGGPGLIEEDEHGFESTLHEMECSDGQYISILRTWNGEQYACLTEVWRKYFPEVNRNHLTSALKRLGLDTHMPTGQQATLLRSAGVISLRGAAGRLMRLEGTQMLLDDFGIPLQINSSSDSKEKPDAIHAPPLPPLPTMKLNSGASVPPHISRRKMSVPGNFTNYMVSSALKAESKEDILHAQCMRNILAAISCDDLVTLLEKSRDEALSCTTSVDEDANTVATELDGVQQLIHSRRELCNILSSEIGYLTASNHAYMAEVVRLNHSGKQILQDLESSLLEFDITLQ